MYSLSKRKIYEEIVFLYKLSQTAIESEDYEWAKILGKHIYNIYKKYNLKNKVKIKKLICKKCYMPVKIGKTIKIRIKSSSGKTYILYTCNNCGYQWKKIIKHKGKKNEKRTAKKQKA